MTIAVHISFPDTPNEINTNFNYNCFTVLASVYPDHHFIFIFDKPFPPAIITHANITPVISGPAVRNRMLQYYFYNFKIPRLLNKYNADLFVSTDICSLRTKTPQCLIIRDLSFLKKKNLFSATDIRYLKRYTRLFIKRSGRVAVMNPTLIATIIKSYNVAAEKIHVIRMGINGFIQTRDHEIKESTRNRLTEGKDYFLFYATAATNENIITMLKAFSIFKKWQKSSMQLVILGNENPIRELSSYKYRADVKTINTGKEDIDTGIIAAAYASIYLPTIEITESEGLRSLAAEVPLITTDKDFFKSTYQDAACYCQHTEKDLSEKMMTLYKDENARNELVSKGRTLAASHSWKNAAVVLWQAIQTNTAS